MKKIFFVLTLLFSLSGFSQSNISGVVYDSETKETMPFVNVFFQGTTLGTSTDIDGNFTINTTQLSDTLITSFIGYDSQKTYVKKGVAQKIEIYLSTKKNNLQEVIIHAGENPAHKIIRNIIENKDRNNVAKYQSYEYESYDRMQFDLNNFDKKFTDKKLLNNLDFMFEQVDSSEYNGKAFVPIFLVETIADEYNNQEKNLSKQVVKARKVHGVASNSINDFLEALELNFNIYDDFMVAFNKNLISPISTTWHSHYKYYLRDSVENEFGTKEYKIEFKRKHKQQVAFDGEMWVDGETFAVKNIKMRIAEDANINFINDLVIEQDFIKQDSLWILKKDKLWLDLNLGDGSKGFFGTKTTTFKNIKINQPKPDEFYTNYVVATNIDEPKDTDKSDEFWEAARHEGLTKSESFIVQKSDSIREAPLFKTLEEVFHTLITGYYTRNKVEYGPYPSLFSYNRIEGGRVKFEAQTSKYFSTNLRMSGHLAYGFQDKRFKYGAKVMYFFEKQPHRKILRVEYKNDVEQLGQSVQGFRDDNIFVSLLRRNPSIKLTNVEEIMASYEYEYKPGLAYTLAFSNKILTPLNISGRGLFFDTDKTPLGTTQAVNNLFSNELTLTGVYEYNARYIEGTFRRRRIKSNAFPLIQADLTLGNFNYLGNTGLYQKINVTIKQRVRAKQFGFFDYVVEGGEIFGSLPYPLLELHDGNEALTYKGSSFNLMNFYEFVSDKYASAIIEHHFDGYFFNKIPLLRKLKWREVAIAKVLVGGLDIKKHSKEFVIPATTFKLTKPYTEVGLAIENIFKLIRIDAVWRLNYLNHPDISNFGVRAGFKILW